MDGFVSVIVIVAVVGTPHDVSLLACFVWLQWEENGLIKIKKIVWNSSLLRNEEIKYISWI